jgi:hypothetical protein
MDGWQALESHTQSSELMQPRDRALDDPPGFAQATAVRSASAGNLSVNSPLSEKRAQRVRIVGAIGLNEGGFLLGRTGQAANRRDRFHQWHELGDVVAIGARQNYRKRDALGVREDVVLAARTTAIGWVRSTFFPAPTARMEELSAMAREKSSLSAPRSLASNTWCSRSQTRARCHACNRRQHVMPEPQPISFGNISHGMPERRTNTIPVSTRRSHKGNRPAWRLRRRFLGSSGSMCFHSSSSISGCGIRSPLGYAMPQRTKSFNKVQASFC